MPPPRTCRRRSAPAPATRTYFSVDSFGAIIPEPTTDAAEVPAEALAGGMQGWAALDSPWTHLLDRARFSQILDGIRRLQPTTILSSHLAAAPGTSIEQFLGILETVPDAEPAVAPSAGPGSRSCRADAGGVGRAKPLRWLERPRCRRAPHGPDDDPTGQCPRRPRSGAREHRPHDRTLDCCAGNASHRTPVEGPRRAGRVNGGTAGGWIASADDRPLVHGLDVRRPLGLQHEVPQEAWRESLSFLTGKRAPGFVSRGRAKGLAIEATDVEWGWGAGSLLRGPAPALALALTGRTSALDELSGRNGPSGRWLVRRIVQVVSWPADERRTGRSGILRSFRTKPPVDPPERLCPVQDVVGFPRGLLHRRCTSFCSW